MTVYAADVAAVVSPSVLIPVRLRGIFLAWGV